MRRTIHIDINGLAYLLINSGNQFIISVVPTSQNVIIKNMYINEYGLYYATFTDNKGNLISDKDVDILIVTRWLDSPYE